MTDRWLPGRFLAFRLILPGFRFSVILEVEMATIALIDNRPIHEKEGVAPGYRVAFSIHSPEQEDSLRKATSIAQGYFEAGLIKEFRLQMTFASWPFMPSGMHLVVREEDLPFILTALTLPSPTPAASDRSDD